MNQFKLPSRPFLLYLLVLVRQNGSLDSMVLFCSESCELPDNELSSSNFGISVNGDLIGK